MKTRPQVLIIPGLGGSGALHWQSLWEQEHLEYKRVQMPNWDRPDCSLWMDSLEEAVEESGEDTVLVAHSLACLLVAHWDAQTKRPIRGAFLVAPPNPYRSDFPSDKAKGFTPLPLQRLMFPSKIIASTNDPYCSMEYAQQLSQGWGSQLINIGQAGHINAASGFGPWPEGKILLESLIQEI